MKKIVHIPDSVLTTPAKKVLSFDRKLRQIVRDMKKTLESAKNPKGVGLAAPQVGISLQIFLIKPTEKSPTRCFINPKITKQSKPKSSPDTDTMEGCLSIPRIWGIVKRSDTVTLRYQDEEGHTRTEDFSGFPATIIQHEMDHLSGVLFPTRTLEQKGKLYQTTRNKEGKQVMEELSI